MSEDAGINNERLEKLAHGGETLKPEGSSELASATGSASCPEGVDMWDQPNGSEGTVSNAVRRLTAQWGLPDARAAMLKNKGITTNQ